MPILEALQASANKLHAPFYAPGHKQGQGIAEGLVNLLGREVFQADLPELPELDNLFAPAGAIAEAQALAAETFGADATWFLVNGSTGGIIAALLATCGPGDRVIVPRNVHQSVISGLILSGAIPIFVNPEYNSDWDLANSLTPATLATALEQHPEAKAVMVVYPTYHGVCGDLSAVAEITHQFNIPLLVDEAHGPHFNFHPQLPAPALLAGADLTVQSTHKVLGALTQASMLHLKGDRINVQRLNRALQLIQSTSPSYLLLASLDAARQQMALQGEALMTRTLQLANEARSRLNQIPGLSVLAPLNTPGFVALDPTRLTVKVSELGLSGFEADEILHDQLGVTAELPMLQHLTFIISLGNTQANIESLVTAFMTLATRNSTTDRHTHLTDRRALSPWSPTTFGMPPLSPREAYFAATEVVPVTAASGRISAELICPYPPGIPTLMPGEIITPDALNYLQQVLTLGGRISGGSDPTLKTIKVVKL
ncbi:MAG: aminotransferase class I/II-fold pyridoxal phosphate-dependent enzyme [Actinomycetota bacterium]